jgi:hypothetical protein
MVWMRATKEHSPALITLSAALSVALSGCPASAPPSPDAAARDLAAITDGTRAGCPPLEVTGGLLPLVDAITAAIRSGSMPGSNAVVVPDATTRDAFAQTSLAAIQGDLAAACALPAPYRLLHLVDPQAGDVLLVAEVDGAGAPTPARFWGTYAALGRPQATPSRDLVVEAPHPVFDTGTEHQAAAVFAAGRARYLLLAGGHRCADDAPSGCDGTTTACGGASAPYHVSDAAHSVALPFWAVHARLSMQLPGTPFLQLHGNAAACPDALVSDGSGTWSDTGHAGRMAAALAQAGVSVGACGQGYPASGCNLCGLDNVEGRFTAGSPDACTQRGAAYGRFVHIEQLSGLRAIPTQSAKGYQPMIDAVIAVFPAQ